MPAATGETLSADKTQIAAAEDTTAISGPQRLAGPNRYGTSAVVAQAWPAGIDVAFVVSGANYPDALAAAARAGVREAPVLLTSPTAISAETRTALQRLKPRRIVVVGGRSAVSDATLVGLRQLSTSGTVDRLAGRDRYETAAIVSRSYPLPVARVYLASGEDFPDALAGAALAGHQGAPLLLSGSTQLDSFASAELRRMSPREVVILGGESVLSARVATQAASLTSSGSVRRLAGKDRYETSAAIAKQFPAGSSPSYVASGLVFPDALVGAALAAWRGVPVVLTSPRRIMSGTSQALTYQRPTAMFILGGRAVLPDKLVAELARFLPAPSSPVFTTPGTQGALKLGSARYTVPADAVFVAPNGSDKNQGSARRPLQTVTAAIDAAPAGGTIVLRGGTYHQRFTVTKKLTIQNYPGEAVWLDGSVPVTAFERQGSAWLHRGWTYEFNSSPTYTWDAPDQTRPGWGFVNPDYPMAAHPDQVWINGAAQRQVKDLASLRPGAFYVDDAQNRLYLGSDPAGKSVRASAIARAIEVRAKGSVLRGFGVRRYAPSVPHMGTITAEAPAVTLENLHITDNATTGLSLLAASQRVNRVTVLRNGMLGVHGDRADGLTIKNLLAARNNLERFNSSPVSGGTKITRTRSVDVSFSTFKNNIGPGFWLDESVYNATWTNSVSSGNAGHGATMEISAKIVIAGNLVFKNKGHGLKINNTSEVAVWNNTIADNGRAVNIVQDARRGDDPSLPGHDPRRPFPDPDQTWVIGPAIVSNNIIAGSTANCLLCVEDYSHEFTAEQMRVRANGNVYQRDNRQTPLWLAVWSRGPGDPAVYQTLAAFRKATGQDSRSISLVGTEAVTSSGLATRAVGQSAPAVAIPLPSAIASLVGQPAGAKHLGSFVQGQR